MSDLETDFLAWAAQQAPWQQDLLRRIAGAEMLSISDYQRYAAAAERAELAKPAPWYLTQELDAQPDFIPLDATHISATVAGGDPVRVTKILHIHGANDLAPGASLDFYSDGLTIIAGKNGSGKSGYTRILKQVAASRAPEKILPNAYSPRIKPKATVSYRLGEASPVTALTWEYGTERIESPLQRVRVFDARSANTQVAEPNPVAYVPASLQILSDYTQALQEVAAVIESDTQKERLQERSFGELESAIGREISENLGKQLALDELRRVEALTPEEEAELDGIPGKLHELTSTNPAAVAAQGRQRAAQLRSLARDLEIVATKLTPDGIELSQKLRDDVEAARVEVERTRSIFTNADVLPGTGNEQWRRMWLAARDYSESDPHQHRFPENLESCPFCVQPLGAKAIARMKLFGEFMSGEAQERASLAQSLRSADEAALTALPLSSFAEQDSVSLVRIYDENLADGLSKWADQATKLRDSLLATIDDDEVECIPYVITDPDGAGKEAMPSPISLDTLPRETAVALRGFAATEEETATTLAATDRSAQAVAEMTTRRDVLIARRDIASNREAIGAQHDRFIRAERLNAAKSSCNTASASNKNSKLSQGYVTKVCQQFEAEAKALGLDRVPVELAFDRTKRGVSYIKVRLKEAPDVPVASVLSEGEQRVAAIAGFFADLTESDDASTLVFDDPVSSLDQLYRSKVAQRLVHEAESRQVLVFTHDFSFVQYLYEEKNLQDTRRAAKGAPASRDLTYLHISRSPDGAGALTGAESWRHVSIKERLGRLSDRCQAARAMYNRNDTVGYEKEANDIVGALREAWEAFVEQDLLSGVVIRHGRSVHTQKLIKITDLTAQDTAEVERGMSVESRYMTGHDRPLSDGSAPQSPDWLDDEVETLKTYRLAVIKRREKK